MSSRILVVESEPTIAAGLADRLMTLGYEVVGVAFSGPEAIARVARDRPDLILLDAHLEGAPDGAETADLLWERFRVPVVFLATQVDVAAMRLPRRAEPFGHVAPPFAPEALRAAIELALQRLRLVQVRGGADPEQLLLDAQRADCLPLLAGGLAHDLNNLLTVIRSHVDQCREVLPVGSPGTTHLRATDEAAQLAGQLCQQLLAHTGRGRFVLERLDLSELVHHTVRLVRGALHNRARVELELAAGLPALLADATQLRQVVLNLLINAAEAGGDARPVIRIGTASRDLEPADLAAMTLGRDATPGRYVVLRVSDGGMGMSADVQARIFDPFFTTKASGRGLGLAAVAAIVRRHHGALQVESVPGQGTTFRIALPVEQAAEPGLQAPAFPR